MKFDRYAIDEDRIPTNTLYFIGLTLYTLFVLILLMSISGVEVIYSCLLAFWGIDLFRPTHLVCSKDQSAHDLLMTKEIKCFKNGRPTSIILDDFLPCSPNTGMPCYAHVDVQGQFVGMKWAFWVRNASLKHCCSPMVRMEWMSGIDWQIFPNAQYNQLLYCIWDSLKIILQNWFLRFWTLLLRATVRGQAELIFFKTRIDIRDISRGEAKTRLLYIWFELDMCWMTVTHPYPSSYSPRGRNANELWVMLLEKAWATWPKMTRRKT